MHAYRTGSHRPRSPRQIIDDDDDELDRLGAQTKLMIEQKPKIPTPPASYIPAPAPAPVSSSSSSSSTAHPMGKYIDGYLDPATHAMPTIVMPPLPSTNTSGGSLTSPSVESSLGSSYSHGYSPTGLQSSTSQVPQRQSQYADQTRPSQSQLYQQQQQMGSQPAQYHPEPARTAYYGSSPTSSTAPQYTAPQQHQQPPSQYYSAPGPSSHGHHHPQPPMMHPSSRSSQPQSQSHIPPQSLQYSHSNPQGLSDPYSMHQTQTQPQPSHSQHWPEHIPGQPVFPPYMSASSSAVTDNPDNSYYDEQMDYMNTAPVQSASDTRVYAEHQMRWSEMVSSLDMPAPFVSAIGAAQPQPQVAVAPHSSQAQGGPPALHQRYSQGHHPPS